MTVSYAFRTTIEKLFREGTTNYFGNSIRMVRGPYEDNILFTRFFNTTITTKYTNFIPVLKIHESLKCIKEWLKTDDFSSTPLTITIPLYTTAEVTKATSEACLKEMAAVSSCNTRLLTVSTTKGAKYYGGGGFVFNGDWEPLMICGYQVAIKETRKLCLVRPVCYVSPKVFINNDMISKVIVKKCIHTICTDGINVSTAVSFGVASTEAQVIIKNIDSYFKVPRINSINVENTTDDIWSFLNNNKEALV